MDARYGNVLTRNTSHDDRIIAGRDDSLILVSSAHASDRPVVARPLLFRHQHQRAVERTAVRLPVRATLILQDRFPSLPPISIALVDTRRARFQFAGPARRTGQLRL